LGHPVRREIVFTEAQKTNKQQQIRENLLKSTPVAFVTM